MFDKFGEFDSAEELNMAAEGFKREGDMESLFELAEENGIDKEDAEDYADGSIGELANPLIAALGKLRVECAELKPVEIMEDWVQYIQARCAESEKMQRAVRKKEKSLKGCVAELLVWSFHNAKEVDEDILKAAETADKDILEVTKKNGKCTLGIPGMGRAREIITKYYLGQGARA